MAVSAATSSSDLNFNNLVPSHRRQPAVDRSRPSIPLAATGWALIIGLSWLLAGRGLAPGQAQETTATETITASPPAASAFDGRLITTLAIEPRTGMTPDELGRLTGIKAGRSFDAGAIRISLDQLYHTGRFSSIVVEAQADHNGVALTFHLLPKQWIRELTITGDELSFSTGRLRTAAQLSVGEEFSPERWQTGLARLLQFYNREGYFQASLTPTVHVSDDRATVRLTITIHEGPPTLIGRLTLRGTPGLPEATIQRLLELSPGTRYSAGHIEEQLKRLHARYEDEHFLLAAIDPPAVHYDPGTNRISITITLQAGPRLLIRFTGNPHWSTTPLRERLLIQTEQSIDDEVLEASAGRIRSLLHDEGYLTATVNVQRTPSPNGQTVTITFQIAAGPRFTVARLTITGNTGLGTAQLLKQLTLHPMLFGLYHPHFDPAQWETDVETLRRLYQQQGFLEARIESRQELAVKKGTASLFLAITEGPQTRIARISFSGNDHVPDHVLTRQLTVRIGEPYNAAQVRADRLALSALYAGKGYLRTDIVLEPQFNDTRTEVTLHFTVTEEAPTFVGRIVIEGNQRTDESVIRRELLVHTGDPYNYENILLSRHRLARLGIFRDIRLDPIETESSGPIRDLKLSITERPAGSVEFGVGIANEEKIRGFIQISHKNLAGTGRWISLRAEADFIEQRYVLTYVEPWLAGLPIDWQLTVLFEKKEEVTFDRLTYGGKTGFEKNLTPQLKFSLFYRYTKNRFSSIVPGTTLPTEEQDRVNIGSIVPSLILDLRDDPFNPHRGSLNSLSFEDAALSLGSEVQFVKTTASSSWFFSPHPLIVLALSGRGGLARQFDITPFVPLSERFYLGGRSTVRGYKQDTLGVLGETLTTTLDPTGGNITLLTNVEVRITLPKSLGLVLFLDGGNVWPKASAVTLSEMKFSTGAGLRYNTPVGPLRLDWGYKLNREVNVLDIPSGHRYSESRYEIYFTLGHAF